MDSATWICTHQGWPSDGHHWVPSLPASETDTGPWYDTILLGDQPATCWWVDYVGLLPSWKGQHLLECTLTLHSDMSSLHTKLPKLPFMELHSAYPLSCINTALPLVKELTSQQMKCSGGPVLMEVTEFCMFPLSWSSWLDRMVDWLFEDSECQLGASTWQIWATFSGMLCAFRVSAYYMELFLP